MLGVAEEGSAPRPVSTPLVAPSFRAWKRAAMVWALACVAAVLLYYPALTRGAFIRDDWFNFEKRPVSHAVAVWSGDWMSGKRAGGLFYRPFVRWSMQVDGWLWGVDRPTSELTGVSAAPTSREWPEVARLAARSGTFGWETPFFLHNALIHGTNTALVWWLLGMIGFGLVGRAAATFLFLCYPTHPGAVFWLSARTDLLVTLWVLVALCALLRPGALPRHAANAEAAPAGLPGGRWWLFLVPGALAFATKESALALPLLTGACLAALRPFPTRRAVVGVLAASLALALAYVVFRLLLFRGPGGYFHGQLLSLHHVVEGYQMVLGALFVPVVEGENHGLWILVGLAAIGAALPRPRLYYTGLAWMLAAIIPLLGLHASLTDGTRYLYLPSVGLAIVFGDVCERLASSLRIERERLRREGRAALAPAPQRILRAVVLGAVAIYILAIPFALALHLGTWIVASRAARDSIRLVAQAQEEIVADGGTGADPQPLVVLNEPKRHYTAYVQDFWSLRKALAYLRGHDDTIVSALELPDIDPATGSGPTGPARSEPPGVLVFPEPEYPTGYLLGLYAVRWDPARWERALLGLPGIAHSVDLRAWGEETGGGNDGSALKFDGAMQLFLPADEATAGAGWRLAAGEGIAQTQAHLLAQANARFEPRAGEGLLFVGAYGGKLEVRREVLDALMAEAGAPGVLHDGEGAGSVRTMDGMDGMDGMDASGASPPIAVPMIYTLRAEIECEEGLAFWVHAEGITPADGADPWTPLKQEIPYGAVTPFGPHHPAASWAMTPLRRLEIHLAPGGGWCRLKRLELDAAPLTAARLLRLE